MIGEEETTLESILLLENCEYLIPIIKELEEAYESYEKCVELIENNRSNYTLLKALEEDASFIRKKIMFLIEELILLKK